MRGSAEGIPVIMEGLYVPNVCPIGERINWGGVFLGRRRGLILAQSGDVVRGEGLGCR